VRGADSEAYTPSAAPRGPSLAHSCRGRENVAPPRPRGRTLTTALYYPHVRVPRSDWFMKVLLYWDYAATIAPPDLHGRLDATHPYMDDLLREGLLRYVAPEDRLIQASDFQERFLTLLDDVPQSATPADDRRTRLHSGKMAWSLFRELADRGLADPVGDGFGWWRVDVAAAGMYLAYLAGALSGAGSDLNPVTDTPELLQRLGARPRPGGETALDSLRYVALDRVLPAPARAVSAADLREFKDANREALSRCRTALDARLADAAALEDPTLREAKTRGVLQEIEDDIARLRESMNRRRWPEAIMVGFAGLAASGASAGAAVVTGGGALAVGLAVGAAVVGLAPTARDLKRVVAPPTYDSRAPFAYAALASRL